jgi:hypothetical protein
MAVCSARVQQMSQMYQQFGLLRKKLRWAVEQM